MYIYTIRPDIYIVHDGHLTLSYIHPCKYIHTHLNMVRNSILNKFNTQTQIRFSVRMPRGTRNFWVSGSSPGYAQTSIPCIVLYCIVSIHLYSASCSAHQSEALPVRETQREESSLERTKRGTWLTS